MHRSRKNCLFSVLSSVVCFSVLSLAGVRSSEPLSSVLETVEFSWTEAAESKMIEFASLQDAAATCAVRTWRKGNTAGTQIRLSLAALSFVH